LLTQRSETINRYGWEFLIESVHIDGGRFRWRVTVVSRPIGTPAPIGAHLRLYNRRSQAVRACAMYSPKPRVRQE